MIQLKVKLRTQYDNPDEIQVSHSAQENCEIIKATFLDELELLKQFFPYSSTSLTLWFRI